MHLQTEQLAYALLSCCTDLCARFFLNNLAVYIEVPPPTPHPSHIQALANVACGGSHHHLHVIHPAGLIFSAAFFVVVLSTKVAFSLCSPQDK